MKRKIKGVVRRCICFDITKNNVNDALRSRACWYRNFCSTAKERLVLGIETSCDDTGIAVVSDVRGVISQRVSSQYDVHRSYQGVVPHLARRAHLQNIEILMKEVMEGGQASSSFDFSELSAIAVTVGPGLGPCLGVGLDKAKELAMQHNLPFIAVNHLEAHALVARLSDPSLQFPFMVCLVSGGHTQLLVCHDVGSYTMLGGTLDDSLGEAYDKIARLLRPQDIREEGGGAMLEALASNGDPLAFPFTVPMRGHQNCDFSFSGLKAAVARTVKQLGESLNDRTVADVAASFQHVAVTHLRERTERALQWCVDNHGENQRVETLVVCGGVARNQVIRKNLAELASAFSVRTIYPPLELCTDNGVMVAWTGLEKLLRGMTDDPAVTQYKPRWPLNSLSG